MCYILAIQSMYYYYFFKYRKDYICLHNELATLLNETMVLSDCITEHSLWDIYFTNRFFKKNVFNYFKHPYALKKDF